MRWHTVCVKTYRKSLWRKELRQIFAAKFALSPYAIKGYVRWLAVIICQPAGSAGTYVHHPSEGSESSSVSQPFNQSIIFISGEDRIASNNIFLLNNPRSYIRVSIPSTKHHKSESVCQIDNFLIHFFPFRKHPSNLRFSRSNRKTYRSILPHNFFRSNVYGSG